MKLLKLLLCFCVVNYLVTLTLSVKFSTATNSKMKIQSANKLLLELQEFNKRAENFKNWGTKGFSEDTLMNESKNLDLKYNELLNVFLEKGAENITSKNK